MHVPNARARNFIAVVIGCEYVYARARMLLRTQCSRCEGEGQVAQVMAIDPTITVKQEIHNWTQTNQSTLHRVYFNTV